MRSGDTKPELILRSAVWRRGLRYRLRVRGLPGRPDLDFKGARVAVFVDGCFWHGCPLHYVAPRSSSLFWSRKLRENVNRDRRQTAELEGHEWQVLRSWEHEVYEDLERVVARIVEAVRCGGRPDLGEQIRVVEVSPDSEGTGTELWTLLPLRPLGALPRVEWRARSTVKSKPPSGSQLVRRR